MAETMTLDVTGRQPLYIQLYDRLQTRIQNGTYEPGSALPSIKQLAAEYDISIITVESALKKLIDAGICYRRPKKGTFVAPSPVAAAPASVVSDPNARQTLVVYAPYEIETCRMLSQLNEGIHAAARNAGMDLLHLSGELEEELTMLEANPGLVIRGVLILYATRHNQLAQLAQKHPNLRFVLLNYQYESFAMTPANLYGVFSEEFGGGYAMTRYLLERGCRKIGILACQDDDMNYSLRIAGYKLALEHFGLPFRPEWVINEPGVPTGELRHLGRVGMEKLLTRVTPDAVFGLNDLLIVGAIEYLRQEHPEHRIIMAGYDHYIPELSLSYGFSSVAVNARGMGETAVEILLQSELPVKSFRLPTTLIQR